MKKLRGKLEDIVSKLADLFDGSADKVRNEDDEHDIYIINDEVAAIIPDSVDEDEPSELIILFNPEQPEEQFGLMFDWGVTWIPLKEYPTPKYAQLDPESAVIAEQFKFLYERWLDGTMGVHGEGVGDILLDNIGLK